MRHLLFLILTAFTFSITATETAPIPLRPGSMLYIDAEDIPISVVSFVLTTKSFERKAVPRTIIHNQWGNFRCKHKSNVLKGRTFSNDNQLFISSWEIQIQWSPGANSAGCSIKVIFPGMKDSDLDIYQDL